MRRIKFNFGKPLPIPIVNMYVSIYTVIITVMLLAVTYLAYRNNMPQLLMVTPLVTAYVVTLYAYLANRLRKEFKEELGKTNSSGIRPQVSGISF